MSEAVAAVAAPAAAPAVQSAPQVTTTGAPPLATVANEPVGQAKPQEPAAAAKPEATPEEKKDRERRAAILARAKRVEAENRKASEAVKSDRAALDARIAAWEQKQDATAKKAAEYDRVSGLINDPLKFLDAAGIKREAVLEAMVKGDTRTPEEIAQAVVDRSLKAQREQQAEEQKKAEAAAQEAQAKRNYEVKAKAVKDMQALIAKNPDKYEACGLRPDAAELAWKVIADFYVETQKTGRPEILPFDEALDSVEEDLFTSYKSFTAKSKKLAAEQAAAKEAEKKKADEAAAAEAAKVGTKRSGIFKEFSPRAVQPAPAVSENLFSVRNRRALGAEFQAALTKQRE